jgi:hypothetical protein
LQERLEPLRDALSALGERADALLIADEEARPDAWRRWAEQLRNVFVCADRCWPALDVALDTAGVPRQSWISRLFRRGRP